MCVILFQLKKKSKKEVEDIVLALGLVPNPSSLSKASLLEFIEKALS